MITNFLLGSIIVELLCMLVFAVKAWQQISTFLTWNNRYTGAEYEQAMTKPKVNRSATKPSTTVQQGRAIKPVDDLVDLADLDFETAANAVETMGE